MIALCIFLTGIFIAFGMGVMASVSDMRTMKIPNSYSVVIGAAFFVTYGLLWLLGQGFV